MKRISIIAVAALAATALVGPTTAYAGGAHLLGLYKVEKHIDIEGEDGTYTVACKTGDIAVDGMWRIDNVDQDNDYAYEPLHSSPQWYDVQLSVEPVAAYASALDTYTFKFLPLSGGDVQGKLFLTCLPASVTALGGHTVSWLPSGQQNKDTAGPTINDLTFAGPVGTPGTTSATDATNACPSVASGKQIAIQPGFSWTTGYGKVYKRTPDDYRYPTLWNWGFITSSQGSNTVRLTWRCLPLASDYNTANPPHHRHRTSTSKAFTVTPSKLAKNLTDEAQVICGEHYKAMLGGWDFTGHTTELWYQGMDPRPKARAFKVINTSSTDIYTDGATLPAVKFGAVCFKDKTT